MNVKAGLVVQLDIDLKVKGGEVIESSKKSGLVAYTHGQGQMLPGLEKQLEGMAAGEEKSGVIPAKDAFGTEESQATMKIPRAEFPKDSKIKVGDRFEAKGPTGTPVTLNVIEITDECTPCHRMDALLPGLHDAMRPYWRGGFVARVEQDGAVAVGDEIRIL